MEQDTKKIDLFKVEAKGGYGIPFIGQVGLFASLGMFIKAGFGPLTLRNIAFEGKYSTDPSVLQNFKITGSLGITAYAQAGLTASALAQQRNKEAIIRSCMRQRGHNVVG